MIKFKIKFFGILNEILGPEITLEVKKDVQLKDIKQKIFNDLFNDNIKHLKNTLDKSVFSNDNEILNNDYIVKNNDLLYLLPPFSGG